MSPDDLDAARARIAALEARIAAQREDIAALRRAAGGEAGARSRAAEEERGAARARSAPGGEARMLAGLVMTIVAGGASLAASQLSSFPRAGGLPGAAVEARDAAAAPGAGPVDLALFERWVDDAERGLETGRLEVPDEQRAMALRSRCDRPRLEPARWFPSRAELMGAPPADAELFEATREGRPALRLTEASSATTLVPPDFRTCVGCDCCEQGSRFPSRDDGVLRYDEACFACSRLATLRSLGIRPSGWLEPRPLRRTGVILSVDPPARLVALGFPTLYASDIARYRGGERWLGAVAYDEDGVAIDADRMLVQSSEGRSGRPLPRSYAVVTACPGEAIARVELSFERDEPLDVTWLSALPSD